MLSSNNVWQKCKQILDDEYRSFIVSLLELSLCNISCKSTLQQSSGPYLIIMILALLLGLLFFIFAGYQLQQLMLLQNFKKMFISMTYLLHSKR